MEHLIGLLSDPNAWAALITLTVLEVVLGIDNVIFISVLVARMPQNRAKRARQIGLSLALVFRILLLGALTWLMRLTEPIATLFGRGLSWRDIILIGGGLFLIAKATHEIHAEVEAKDEADDASPVHQAFLWSVAQLIVVDLVFSLDSIITAIGMAQHVPVMIAAVIIAMGVMWVSAGAVGGFIHRHPTTKMLALAFLMLIGVSLVADGVGMHIPRGYIYFAMAFAALVESVNILAKRRRARMKEQQKAVT
jgi:predicted tellurium resistance membrane protein TerC